MARGSSIFNPFNRSNKAVMALFVLGFAGVGAYVVFSSQACMPLECLDRRQATICYTGVAGALNQTVQTLPAVFATKGKNPITIDLEYTTQNGGFDASLARTAAPLQEIGPTNNYPETWRLTKFYDNQPADTYTATIKNTGANPGDLVYMYVTYTPNTIVESSLPPELTHQVTCPRPEVPKPY